MNSKKILQTLTSNQQNAQSLVHSAFDIAPQLHHLAQWLIEEAFTKTPKAKETDKVNA
jgi:hypothetical protein